MTRRALFAALASLPFVRRLPSLSAWREENRYRINCGNSDTPRFEEHGGVQTFRLSTPWVLTGDAAGSRVVATFVRDDDTGRWYEYDRS